MDAEELAKHRQEYWNELVRFMESYRFGPPATYKDLQYLMSQITDGEIIRNVENGVSPFSTIEALVYYETQLPLPRRYA